MSKRGRKASWWGWDYFSPTDDKSASGYVLYQCQVPCGLDAEGKAIPCLETIAYPGSPTPLKSHLSGKHREWHARTKPDDSEKTEKKQRKLTEVGVEVKKEGTTDASIS